MLASDLKINSGSKGHCIKRKTAISIGKRKDISANIFFDPNILSKKTVLRILSKMNQNLLQEYKKDCMDCSIRVKATAHDRESGLKLNYGGEECVRSEPVDRSTGEANFYLDFISNDKLKRCRNEYVYYMISVELITDLKIKYQFIEEEDDVVRVEHLGEMESAEN